ncbi:hypothetical protein [Gimesia fumaroli]|uniref:hypothetical protein n=1 Tax=Gimesia fumaroli TaxID=2527976 RepID=UPI0018D85EBE|nr:hypothetical protein [Gimesia fumaroli]
MPRLLPASENQTPIIFDRRFFLNGETFIAADSQSCREDPFNFLRESGYLLEKTL